jgi:cyclic-di-GMP phosphodiesterase, flagellum assembly factor TipF
MAGLKTIRTLGATGGAALAGGATGAAVTAAAGAPALAAGLAGLVAAGCAVAAVRAFGEQARNAALQRDVNSLHDELAQLREHQAQSQAKMAEIERRTIESPALVWRAASADIEVLGSLVSELAKSVAEHNAKLATLHVSEPTGAKIPEIPAAPAAEWYEDEAELGFTADVPVTVNAAGTASPAVLAELKSTLASALTSDRLELCLQPIVALPQRKTRGYEATLRLKGEQDDLQTDADLRRIAGATQLEPELDRVLVNRAVHVLRILRARERDVSLLCAISGAALSDAAFLDMLERLVRQDAGLGSALVLEISDADLRALSDATRATMTMLSGKGIRFGLSRLPHLRVDVAEMVARGMRQVRIAAQTLSDAGQESGTGTDIHPADLAEYLQRRGIELLVSQVASEQTILDLLDFTVPLAIGPLFGAARPVRPEILEPKAVGSPAGIPTARSASPKKPDEPPASSGASPRTQRQSFRSLLRRA